VKVAGEKILIIEDDDNQRLLYREELEELGYRVIEAANAEEGLRLVEEEKPDLVILDIWMPDMNGLETLTRIYDMNPNLPVIINTAYSAYQDRFTSWLAEAYVVKSADLSELINAVQRSLESRSKEKKD
jgi:DNA-binding NtrC family response regulator